MRPSKFLPGVVLIFFALLFAWFWQGIPPYMPQRGNEAMKLQGDALTYYRKAMSEQSFYAASLREPLFPFILRLGIRLIGVPEPQDPDEVVENHFAVRRLTGGIGLLLVGLIGALGWRLGGQWCGAISAWMYASSSFALAFSVSGLRQTTMGVLLVLLLLLLVFRPEKNWLRWLKIIAVCLVCAALPLVRLSSLVVVPLVMIGWSVLTIVSGIEKKHERWLVAEAAVYILVAWLAALPFLLNCKQRYGDPFHIMSIHSTFWRNHEYAGKPGFPTREQVIADPYRGERISSHEYLFAMHSFPEVIGRYARGYYISFARHLRKIFAWFAPRQGKLVDYHNPLYWLWPLGILWVIVLWRTHALLLITALTAQFPFAFIVPLNTVLPGRYNTGVNVRFSMSLAPFVAVLVGLGIVKTVAFIYAGATKRKHETTEEEAPAPRKNRRKKRR